MKELFYCFVLRARIAHTLDPHRRQRWIYTKGVSTKLFQNAENMIWPIMEFVRSPKQWARDCSCMAACTGSVKQLSLSLPYSVNKCQWGYATATSIWSFGNVPVLSTMVFTCIIPLLWTYQFMWLADYVAFQIRRKISISSSNGCVCTWAYTELAW